MASSGWGGGNRKEGVCQVHGWGADLVDIPGFRVLSVDINHRM